MKRCELSRAHAAIKATAVTHYPRPWLQRLQGIALAVGIGVVLGAAIFYELGA